MQKSEIIIELAKALSIMQSQLQPAPKDSENPFFKSHYADLASVWDAVKKPLTDNGLSVVQTVDCDNSAYVLVTTLFHSSGQWVSSRYPLNPTKPDPQSFGACVTYARRYALSAICGVCAVEDDDGNTASKPELGKPEKTEYKAPQKATQKPVVDDIPLGDTPSDKVVDAAKEVFDGKEVPTAMANEKQRKMFYAICKGKGMSDADMKTYLSGWNVESSWKIPASMVNEIIADIKQQTGEAKP